MQARALAARLDPWAPPLAVMALIFVFSSLPDLSSGLGTVDLVGRKLIHAAEYGLLAWLWLRALRTVATERAAVLAAAAITIAYAASDEFHQTFVSGRNGSPVDVLIDAIGVAVALVLATRIGRREPARSGA